MKPMRIRIATRKSPLAIWQAEHVSGLIRALEPRAEIDLVRLTTRGDRILDQALSKVGGKDLFVKEIEQALLDGRADVAVHSLKDMPTELPEGLEIAAFPAREDARDALVAPAARRVDDLPRGARVGTSSLRRAAQLLRRRPDLVIVPIRGNVETRIAKLEERGLDAAVLALAGLVRLGLESAATEVLSIEDSLPAIGQGIMAVETRADGGEVRSLVRRLDVPASRLCATAERAFLHRLEGGCQVPIAGYATIAGTELVLRGLVASPDGRERYEDRVSGPCREAEWLGVSLGERLIAAGAGKILDGLRPTR